MEIEGMGESADFDWEETSLRVEWNGRVVCKESGESASLQRLFARHTFIMHADEPPPIKIESTTTFNAGNGSGVPVINVENVTTFTQALPNNNSVYLAINPQATVVLPGGVNGQIIFSLGADF